MKAHDEELFNTFGHKRISARQTDELIGLARGLCADRVINSAEVEFLEKWLAANVGVADNALLADLYRRVRAIMLDGVASPEECQELFCTLESLASTDIELGETLKSCSLPVDAPEPVIAFEGQSFCFTGTFNFGGRRDCEAAITQRGGLSGNLTRSTNFLIIGAYATESWKHSAFGTKILKACEMRDEGVPICIVRERHWAEYL